MLKQQHSHVSSLLLAYCFPKECMGSRMVWGTCTTPNMLLTLACSTLYLFRFPEENVVSSQGSYVLKINPTFVSHIIKQLCDIYMPRFLAFLLQETLRKSSHPLLFRLSHRQQLSSLTWEAIGNAGSQVYPRPSH